LRHSLLAKLARFELSPGQVERIADPNLRAESGIISTEVDLVANPYILSESDLGTRDSNPVALETIDHGMRPEGDVALFLDDDEVPQDDRRRVRAVAHVVLREAANNGDTVLTLQGSDFEVVFLIVGASSRRCGTSIPGSLDPSHAQRDRCLLKK